LGSKAQATAASKAATALRRIDFHGVPDSGADQQVDRSPMPIPPASSVKPSAVKAG
jgi:hypothetical protein